MVNTDSNTNDGRRILVADDDPAILRLVSTILEKENFTVVTARDGREARFPALGPIYAFPQWFSGLPHTEATRLQQMLLESQLAYVRALSDSAQAIAELERVVGSAATVQPDSTR